MEIVSFIEACWHQDPASRPTFKEAKEMLKTVDVDVRHIPLLLKLCNDILKNQILFVLASLFQLHVNDIVMDDLFVVKYSCGDAALVVCNCQCQAA